MSYQTINDVYYTSSDGGIEDFQFDGVCNKFVGVIGGYYFLNLITYLKPNDITLVDINPNAIPLSEMLIHTIRSSKDVKHFFQLLKDYSGDEMLDNLSVLGNACLDGGRDIQKDKITGRARKCPLECWGYALENFKDLKEILRNAKIEYTIGNIKEIKTDCDVIWFSNLFIKEPIIEKRGFWCYIFNEIQEIRELDSIREIEINDYPLLKEQASKEGSAFYREGEMTHYGYFVNNKLISFIGFLPLSKDEVYFKNSFTIPELRRKGYSTLLDNYRRKRCKELGFKKWSARVTKANLNIQLRAGAKIVEKYSNGGARIEGVI